MNVGNKDWPKPNYLCKCSSCGAQFAGPKRAPLCWGCWEGKSFERNLENGKLTAERDRLREALEAEDSARMTLRAALLECIEAHKWGRGYDRAYAVAKDAMGQTKLRAEALTK